MGMISMCIIIDVAVVFPVNLAILQWEMTNKICLRHIGYFVMDDVETGMIVFRLRKKKKKGLMFLQIKH